MKMTSGHVEPMLSAYLDGELTTQDRHAVRAHLDACEACRTELASLQSLSTLLAAEVEPDPGFLARFRANRDRVIENAMPWLVWRRLALRLVPVAMAAIVVALAVLGLSSTQEALLDLEARALGSSSPFIGVEDVATPDPVLRIAFEPFPGEVPR